LKKLKVAIIGKSGPGDYTSRLYTGFSGKVNNGCLDLTLYVRKNEPYVGQMKAERVWSSYLYPFQIFKRVIRDKPDVVHVQHEFNMFGSLYTILMSPILYLLLKLARVQIVSTVHTVIRPWEMNKQYVAEMYSKKARIFALPIRLMTIFIYQPLRLSTIIVHLSSQKEVLHKYYTLDERRITVMPHGVDDPVPKANGPAVNKWLNKASHRKIVLYFGFIHPRKGIEYLVEAFKRFRSEGNNWVLIVGGGVSKGQSQYLDRLKQRVGEDYNHNVFFTGFLSIKDVHVLYDMVECLVLPYTHVVGNSSPASIAMQHGTPIIASDLSPFNEDLVKEREVILCTPNNSDAITKAINLLNNNPHLANEISGNLRSKASKRTWAIVASATYEIYRKSVD
jgi:glycosyltransferase involved in cell wall biosynthesis